MLTGGKIPAPDNKKTKTKIPALQIASWNVHTMRKGISIFHDVPDTRKTAIIDRELTRLNISIAKKSDSPLAAPTERRITPYFGRVEGPRSLARMELVLLSRTP